MQVNNRKALQTYQPELWTLLEPLGESPFTVQSEGFTFLGQFWPFHSLEPVPKGAGVVLFGIPPPGELEHLMAMNPWRLLLVEPQIELAWAMLSAFDYSPWLADTRVEWCLDIPAKLLLKFEAALARFRDVHGLCWRESQPAIALSEKFQSVFLQLGYRAWHQRLTQAAQTPAPGHMVKRLFAELQPALDQAYQIYPLHCPTGCSDCCRRDGVSLLIACYPGEWALVWESVSRWLWRERCVLAHDLYDWAQQNLSLLEALWQFFDTHMDQTHTAEFNLRHLELIASQRHLPCFLLDQEQGRCRVYAGRPLSCRLFGASQYYGKQPYTCERDWEQQEKILFYPQEGIHSRLVPAEPWRKRLREAHALMPYKLPLAFWLLSHLSALTAEVPSPARLDYAQFRALFAGDPPLSEQIRCALPHSKAF